MDRDKDGALIVILPVLLLACLGHIGSAWNVFHSPFSRLFNLTKSLAQVEAKLRVNLVGLGLQKVVVDASLLQDAAVSLHRDLNFERLSKKLTEVCLAHNVGLHGYERVLH